MEINIKKDNVHYDINFNHNVEKKFSAVTIFKNGKFLFATTKVFEFPKIKKLINGRVVVTIIRDNLCKDCGRKEALAEAFAKVGQEEIPRTHRFEIWETYRTQTKVPRWSQAMPKGLLGILMGMRKATVKIPNKKTIIKKDKEIKTTKAKTTKTAKEVKLKNYHFAKA